MKTKNLPNQIFQFVPFLQRSSWSVLLLLIFFLGSSSSWGQISQQVTYNANGTFIVPAGVTQVTVECWGGGAAGSNIGGAAGGGGGGAYTRGILTGLTSGSSLTVTVGAGGTVSGTQATTNGKPSSVGAIVANGGTTVISSRNGGTGGAASAITGSVTASFAGGNGGNARANTSGGNNEAGGGGGGSAFTTAAGNNGSIGASSTNAVTNGGTGTGNGGSGAAADGGPDATAGSAPGGGGGGRGEGGGTSRDGAAGRVIITYTVPPSFFRSVASGNWSSTSTWEMSANNTTWIPATVIPSNTVDVTIQNGHTVTVDQNSSCSNLIFPSTEGNSSVLKLNDNVVINISGSITLYRQGNGGNVNTLDVGNGILNVSNIQFTNSSNNTSRHRILIGTGELNVSQNITQDTAATSPNITFVSTGTLRVGGSIITQGTFVTFAGCTVEYNGNGPQTAREGTYLGNVTLSGSGLKTFGTAPTINGVLSMEGTATISIVPTYGSNATLRYNTTTARTAGVEWPATFTALGGVVINNTGAITLNESKVFDLSDPLVINAGATLLTNNNQLTLGGNFTNSGTFTAGSSSIVITNTMSAQSISGFTTTGTVSMTKTAGTATFTSNVNGGALTINGTGGTLNLGAGLTHTFTGTWARTNGTLNGGSSTLNLSNATAFSGTGGTFTAGTGTVNYSGANQSVAAVTYNNLVLSGSGTKTFGAITSVGGNLNINSGVISNLGTFTHSAGTLTLGGFGTNSGSFGSTTSSATYKTNTFFAATTGRVNVATGTCGAITGTFSGAATICSGASTNLSIAISGGVGPYTVVYSGITLNNYTSGNAISVSPTTTTTYSATVSDAYGCTATISGTPIVTVNNSPSITTQPTTPAATCSGTGTQTISVVATGTGLTYQWRKGGVNLSNGGAISGATTATLTLTAPTSSDAGSYDVVVSGTCSPAVTSTAVTVTVTPSNTIVAGINRATCINTAITSITLATTGATGATFSGLPAGVSGSWASNVVTISGTPTASGSFPYTVTLTGGCGSVNTTGTITVTTAPSAGTLSGTQSICSNGTTTFTSTVAGGAWTSSDVAVATINNTSGVVTPVAAGTATMTYTVTGTGGCANATATRTVTVTAAPSAGTLSGTQSICSNGTTTFSSSVAGGAWTSSDVAVATINNTSGVVTPVAAGTATMTYTVTGTGGCANATATRTVTVTTAPSAGTLSGNQSICANDTTTFSSTVSGGTWTSGNAAVANINSASGLVTPVTAGTATITYTVTGTGGCTNATATRTVTVSPLSVGGSVSGTGTICSGANSGVLTLSGHTGTVVRWESAVSPFTTWTPIANTATTYTSGSLTQETKFRAVVQSGACSEATSAEATLSFSTTTWNGTSWVGGAPSANKTLVIAGNYTSPGNTFDLQGCSLTVQNNAVVTIVPLDSVVLSGPLTVASGSTMTFEAKAHLIQSGTTNQNSGNVIVKANSSPIKRLDYTLWSAPVAGQQLQAFSPTTLANRFYNYDSNTNFYTVVASPSTTSFETAKGVLIRVANNHSASQPQAWTGTFTGVPNNGTYTIPLANFGPGKRFTLVGNPYPSPIDPEAFITNANNTTAITGTLYLWRKTNGSNKPSYCTFNLGGFITNGEDRANEVASLPYQVIQTGQGFFVEGTGAGSGNVVFDNSMRIDDHTNSFLRTANTANTTNTVERNRIWLNMTNAAGAFSQTMIGYVANATNGVDLNYDGKYINDGEIALASILNAEPYAIQCKALPFTATDVIPLQFTATTAGTYAIAIDRVDGLFAAGQNVYLRDNLSGTVHNLTEGAYSFASNSGSFNARFEVVFQSSTLGVNDPVLNENQVVIYKTPSNEISINTGNFVMDNVMIYDLSGRLLYQQKDINNSQALIKVGFATEVLLVKIKTQDGKSVTKKVLFQRTTLKKDLKISTIQVAEDE